MAIDEARASGAPHPPTVRLILDRRVHARQQPPPMRVPLPDDPKVRDLSVIPHPLEERDPDEGSPTATLDHHERIDPFDAKESRGQVETPVDQFSNSKFAPVDALVR